MSDNVENQKDDEISLIDLFAVLIRYRKMILSIILCSIIVVIAGYFVYPSIQERKKVTIKTYETIIAVNLTPGARYLLSNQSIIPSYILYFINPLVIQDVFKDTQKISLQSNELLQWIPSQYKISGDLRTYTSPNNKFFLVENPRNGVLEIHYNGNDPQSGIAFLQSIFLHCSMALENYLSPLAKAFIDTYEASSLPAANNDYIMVKAIYNGKIPALVQLYDPYVLETTTVIEGRRYSIIALIIIFAAVFFSLFFAFCINALKNIKNDQETMRKLRSALGNSGK